MGSSNTFFFQPGVPSRRNPLIPERNVELTEAIAAHHAAVFDGAGRLYYSREGFDDFYLGKGRRPTRTLTARSASCSSRRGRPGTGWRPRTAKLAFVYGIKNQLLAVAVDGRRRCGQAPGTAGTPARLLPRRSGRGGGVRSGPPGVFHVDGDRGRAHRMLDLLLRHEVEVPRDDRGDRGLRPASTRRARRGWCRWRSPSRRSCAPSSRR